MNYNRVTIVGRVTKKPELRSTPGGQNVTTFGIGVTRSYTDKTGAKQEDVNFFNTVFWGKVAQIICQYVEKGQLILVEGRLQNRSWDKNGTKHYATEIIGENFQFGPKKKDSPAGAEPAPEVEGGEGEIKPEDLPF